VRSIGKMASLPTRILKVKQSNSLIVRNEDEV